MEEKPKQFIVIDAAGKSAQQLEEELNEKCNAGWVPFQVVGERMVLGRLASAMTDIAQVMKSELGEQGPMPPGTYWDEALKRYVEPTDPLWQRSKFEELSKPRAVK